MDWILVIDTEGVALDGLCLAIISPVLLQHKAWSPNLSMVCMQSKEAKTV